MVNLTHIYAVKGESNGTSGQGTLQFLVVRRLRISWICKVCCNNRTDRDLMPVEWVMHKLASCWAVIHEGLGFILFVGRYSRWGRIRNDREGYLKCAALTYLAFYSNLPAMDFSNRLGDCQTEATPSLRPRTCFVHTVETFKDMW